MRPKGSHAVVAEGPDGRGSPPADVPEAGRNKGVVDYTDGRGYFRRNLTVKFRSATDGASDGVEWRRETARRGAMYSPEDSFDQG